MNIDSLYRSLKAMAEKASAGMRQILSNRLIPPVNMGGLISRTELSVTKLQDGVVVESDFPEYAYFADKGRGPGKMPPHQPIYDWVKRHNIPVAATFPIRRKIAEKGTEGKNFTEPLKRMIANITAANLGIVKDLRGEFKNEYEANIKDINVKL